MVITVVYISSCFKWLNFLKIAAIFIAKDFIAAVQTSFIARCLELTLNILIHCRNMWIDIFDHYSFVHKTLHFYYEYQA